jgi:hypothetical protein
MYIPSSRSGIHNFSGKFFHSFFEIRKNHLKRGHTIDGGDPMEYKIVAELSEEQITAIRQLEEQTGVILVAYQPETEDEQ